jgi:SET domain-containing protein
MTWTAIPPGTGRAGSIIVAPNCEAEWEGGRIWITARRDIAAGEEITFNYGYTLDEYREHPCHCGAPECAGYIVAEEYFECVRKK